VATLSNDQAQTVAVVSADANKRQLLVKLIGGQSLTPQQSLQLWAVPKQGNPVSMGVLAMEGAANGQLVLPLPDNVTPQTIPLLAISLEPKGGSRNPNGPSGPILYKGAWVSL
jgi:anti-sigma-K factor RskA